MQRSLRGITYLILAVLAASDTSYYTQLKSIQTSDGVWDHVFDPDRESYRVSLAVSVQSVHIDCRIDTSRYRHARLPHVLINNSLIDYGADSAVVSRKFTLATSSYGAELLIPIVVTPPDATEPHSRYLLVLTRPPNFEQILNMKQLRITDMHGQVFDTQPPFISGMPAASKYVVAVPANTRRVNMTIACGGLRAVVGINSATVASGDPYIVPLESKSTRTFVTASCNYLKRRSQFAVEFREHVNLDAVSLTLRLVGDEAVGLVKRQAQSTFVISTKTNSVIFVPLYNDTRVGLELLKKDGQVFPLGIGIPSPPLLVPTSGTEAMQLVLHSDAQKRKLDLFLQRLVSITTTTPQPPRHRSAVASKCGFLVAWLVIGALATVSFIRGFSESVGLGTPRFTSPALRSLTLLLQFVILNATIMQPCILRDFADQLQWLALVPPRGFFSQARLSLGLFRRLSQSSDIGIDVEDAVLCLCCSGALVGMILILHVLVLARLLIGGCCNRRYTLPHRLRLGGWEARSLVILSYPVSFASVLLFLRLSLVPPPYGSTTIWYLSSTCALSSMVGLALAAECAVRDALSRRLVTWVFENYSTNLSQHADYDEPGYFCDATCDQLSTLPTERSCCATFISHRWGTTVADIHAIEIEQTLTERLASARLQASRKFPDDVAAVAENKVDVEVVATLRPGALWQPFYTEVGRFFNVYWLHAQLDASALLRLHQEVDTHLHDFATPLRVNVSQLQGPVTSGWLSFCFDGLHWPHLPPAELLNRICLGALTAVTLAVPSMRSLALLFSSFLSSAFFMFIFFHTPCTTVLDNAMLLLTHLGLAFVSVDLAMYSMGLFSNEICSWAMIVCVVVVAFVPLVYAVFASATLLLAATCPAVSEEELENNCMNNIDLSLRGPHDSWLLVLPAACAATVSEAFVQTRETTDHSVRTTITENVRCARPRLEFPVLDYLASKDKLEIPRVVLFGPSQDNANLVTAYRSETIYGDEDPNRVLADFLKRTSIPQQYVADLTSEVIGLLRRKARPGRILVVDFLEPPRRRSSVDDVEELSSAGSDDERETLIGTQRNSTNRMRELRKATFEDDWEME